MSIDDFEKCEFDEFESVCNAWSNRTETNQRESWEQMRLLATISIQPHIKKKITPKQLLPMPWDSEKPTDNAPKLSREEQQKRFESLSRRLVQ